MRVYTIRRQDTYSTAITILQLTAPSTSGLVILRAWCNQGSSTTTGSAVIELVRKSSAATGTTSVTPVKQVPGDGAAASTAGYNATGEGTDGDVLLQEGFNVLNGWLYLPVPEEREYVAPSGVIALKFSTAPSASYTFNYGIRFGELE